MKYFLLLVLLLAQLGSYLLFCKGFFPTKVLLSPDDLATYQPEVPDSYEQPEKRFNKLIFMVVDAMRADFMLSNNSYMSFTQDLLNQDYGIGFTAYSNPPTVTLPRLKGITTGSTPNFIDAVLNIAEEDTSSSLGDQDSWVKQMHQAGWRINMFGDDTWLKLFPSYFTKTDGTASFYVSDFTIVDNNVTRHLDYELSQEGRDNWDCLILHYLGLDHIGHKGGPQSANMPHKQREMDGIIKRIFEDVLTKDPDTLLVVLGDHGMNEVGNHGGSSIGEVSAALGMFSSKFKETGNKWNNDKVPVEYNNDFNYLEKIDQIDLVPTLTTLLGLDIPVNNLGRFATKLFPLYEEKDYNNVLIKNALQLKVLTDKSNGKATRLETDVNIADYDSLLSYLENSKEDLSRSSSNYNYDEIHLGICLYAITTLIALGWFYCYYKGRIFEAGIDIVTFVLYAASFFGSSLIEEEHHIWWFFTIGFMCIQTIKSIKVGHFSFISTAILFGSLRILKAWNNSGQKYNLKSSVKLSSYINNANSRTGPNLMMLLLILTGIPLLSLSFYRNRTSITDGVDRTDKSFINFLCISVLYCISASIKFISYIVETYDVNDTSIAFPRWTVIALAWLEDFAEQANLQAVIQLSFSLFYPLFYTSLTYFAIKPLLCKYVLLEEYTQDYMNNILSVFTLLLINQTNFANVPIFAVLLALLFTFRKIIAKESPEALSNILPIFTILLQNLTFFQFGSTNTLSTVDLTNTFNGLSSYNMFLSAILTFICNWAGPIFWSISYLKLATVRTDFKEKKWDILFNKLIVNSLFYSIGGLFLMLSCYNLRFHLFIWTVFSPKLLYFLSWLCCNLLIDFLLSYLILLLYI